METFPKPSQSDEVVQAPEPTVPAVRRYNALEAFAPPTDVDAAWRERDRMITAILSAGMATLRERAVKYVRNREKEEFYRNAQQRKPQPAINLEDLLDVFNS